jgi:nucleoside-diphosphate-sugar epimerase
MPDAMNAAIHLMEADPSRLKHRNSFNISSMSLDPEMIAAEIKKHIPDFTMDYVIDEVKQGIADSWPNSMDDSCARREWDWKPKWNLITMTEDMLNAIRQKQAQGLI